MMNSTILKAKKGMCAWLGAGVGGGGRGTANSLLPGVPWGDMAARQGWDTLAHNN